MRDFAKKIMLARYAHPGETCWEDIATRVVKHVMAAVDAPTELVKDITDLVAKRQFMPGGRYLYAAGRPYHQVQNCLLLKAEDTREGWAELLSKSAMALMTGAGIGVVYNDLRGYGERLTRVGGYSSGPLALMQAVNEVGRAMRAGGTRRAAIWAGLRWNHPDIFEFITQKNHSKELRESGLPLPMELTNISVILDDAFFDELNGYQSVHAKQVYETVINNMVRTAEPGFSIDIGENTGENLRNACTEITSYDDSDICNLGSINMARITSLAEMRRAVSLGTAFLLAGTVYSDLPYPKVGKVRAKNRRLGLGLMGLHEWLLLHGRKYGPCSELQEYLDIYANSGREAQVYANAWELGIPIKTRAIAPTGTIGIVAETTTGIEPIFCVAYKRRFWEGKKQKSQYVIDPTAARLVEMGVSPHDIEDAYTLADDVERRVAFQAWVQQYVDHAISSTINLPAGYSSTKFGDIVLPYLPQLRGLTVYPDGCRDGQPLTRVDWNEAIQHENEVEEVDVCDLRGGSCGA
jgi:ribonucleoside-diphosphate reductase alpha chain